MKENFSFQLGNNEHRDEDRWGGVQNYFPSIEHLKDAKNINDGLTVLGIGGTFIDIYTELKPGTPLYIYFNGAQERALKGIKLPVFSGRNVHPESCSRLSISDPALHLDKDIAVGWYAGSNEFSTQKVVIPAVLEKIISLAKASTVVFVGGSGGGFASLYFSRLYPDSVAVVSNPQTNLLKYRERHVRKFLQVCYGFNSIRLAERKPGLTLGINRNLCWLYDVSRGELKNKIIYMQNIKDKFHYTGHYAKFARALNVDVAEDIGIRQQGNLLTMIGDWGIGHKPAPRPVWRTILKNICLYENQLNELMSTNQAKKLIIGDADDVGHILKSN